MAKKVLSPVRNFVAIPLEGEIREILFNSVMKWRGMQPSLKWEKRGNFHSTLKFIGNSAPEELKIIQGIISQVFSDASSFCAPVTRIGAFPNMKRARVVWLGTIFPDEFVKRINDFDRVLFEKLSIPMERKPFVPHITIARVKNIHVVSSLIREFEEFKNRIDGMNFRVTKVVHFKSELRPSGAIHTPMFELNLK